jgi:uroporphyrin-III C-methyltransferase
VTGQTSSAAPEGPQTPRRIVVAGGGPAAQRFADAMQARGLHGWHLTVLAEEAHLPYDRVALSRALTDTAVDLTLGSASRWDHAALSLKTGERVIGIDTAGKTVETAAGSVYVFGRGGEEVAACVQAGVPVRVISGVTSAISVPAAAGIPVTHREVSHLFTVVSGHAPLTEKEHEHLAGLGGTIVVLMGIGTLHQLAAGLRRAGMPADTPVAVVERGYRPGQRTTIAELGTIAGAAAGCSSPAVLVIGGVVRVAEANRGHGGAAADLDRLAASLMGA